MESKLNESKSAQLSFSAKTYPSDTSFTYISITNKLLARRATKTGIIVNRIRKLNLESPLQIPFVKCIQDSGGGAP